MRKHHQVREGQIVRVIDGPFTGFRGEVKEVDEQTAKVAVQVFGRVPRWTWHLGRSNWCQKIQTEAQPARHETPEFHDGSRRRGDAPAVGPRATESDAGDRLSRPVSALRERA